MLLALEPRMVFDASVAAANDAPHPAEAPSPSHADTQDSAPEQTRTAAHDSPPVRESGAGPLQARSGDGPQLFASQWSEPSSVTFNGPFTMNEGATLAFGPDGVRLDDPDSLSVVVTISVEHGTLSLDYVPGVEHNQYYWGVNKDDPNDWGGNSTDKTVVRFEADIAIARQVLDTLKFTGDKYHNGAADLTVTVNDGYNILDFTQSITINPLPDKPAFADLPADAGVSKPLEDTDTILRFNYGTPEIPVWKPLTVGDPDSGDAGYTDRYDLTLSITHGTLSGTFQGLTLAEDGQTPGTYRLNNLSLDQVNGILADLHFLGEQDFYGKAAFAVSVKDLHPGLTDSTLSRTFDIDVLAVNDAPTLQPAAEADRGRQLHVGELLQNPDGSTAGPAEGIFTLGHFHNGYTGQVPDADGNLALFDVDNNLYQLVVKIDSAPANGDLWRKIGNDWVKLGAGSTFSLMDVHQNNVKYIHDPAKQVREELAPGSGKDSFRYTINDGAGDAQTSARSGVVHIALDPANQPPSVVVEARAGIIPEGRLDSSTGVDPITGQMVTRYTIWAYEGEQGIAYSFNIVDPDQAPGADFTVKFTQLPAADLGAFWYSADGTNYARVGAGMELSLRAIQNGWLRFNHSGKENGGSVTFKVQVTDDGGGEGDAGKRTVEQTLALNIRPNNDHPEWGTGAAKDFWAGARPTITGIDGSRTVVLGNDVFTLADRDSAQATLTYTITNTGGDAGKLVYYLGTEPDGEGGTRPVYREIRVGDKITQTDINSGNVRWWFHDNGAELNSTITFTVRDGSMTATPVPADNSDLPYPLPAGYTSPSNWERGAGSHEGGIGTWVETGAGSGVYAWKLTEHTLNIRGLNIVAGEGGSTGSAVDPVPHFDATRTAAVVEGRWVQLDKTKLHAWFTNGASGPDITDQPGYSSATGLNLTYRVEEVASHGTLLYLAGGTGVDDPGAVFAVIGHCGSFTQADVDAGRIFYLHNGSEQFTDSFVFSVSDGRHEVENPATRTTRFTQAFDISPRNDSPEARAGKDLEVHEHGTGAPDGAGLTFPDQASVDHTAPGGSKALTLEQLNIHDRDTGNLGGARDPGGYSAPNDLYVVITDLPQHGTLWYNTGTTASPVWVRVTATAPADLNAILAGGGWSSWATDPAITDKTFTVISRADIAAGKLVYQHDGSEQFYDGFKYLVSDNKGIAPTDADHDFYQYIDGKLALLAGNQASVSQGKQAVNIVVKPVNDIPERKEGQAVETVTVDEGSSVVLTRNNIWFTDPDGSAGAIQFILAELPQYGQITLNGKVLGVGSVFTQADIDAGRVKYSHNDTENHADSFKFNVSDSVYTSANAETALIDINPVNKAPTLTVVNDQLYVDSIAGGIIIKGITVADPDFGGRNPGDAGYPGSGITNDHLTVDITLSQGDLGAINLDLVVLLFKGYDGNYNPVGANPPLTSVVRNGDTITLVGSYDAVSKALSEVTVRTMLDGGTTYDPDGDIKIDIVVHDGVKSGGDWVQPNGDKGGVYSDARNIRVYISPVNDAPVINDPQMDATLREDSGYTPVTDKTSGEAIRIADKDAFSRGGNSITLTVAHGTLMVDAISGVSVAGRGSGTLTVTGPLDAINAALATLKYKPDADYNGADTIRYTYKDYGNSGDAPDSVTKTAADNPALGEAYRYNEPAVGNRPARTGLAVNGEFVITVTPANDEPVIDAPAAVYLQENTVFNGTGKDLQETVLKIGLDDIDISGPGVFRDNTITARLTAASGTLSFDRAGPPSYDLPAGLLSAGAEGTSTLTLRGTLDEVNAALAHLKYSRTNWDSATDTLTIAVTDPGTGANQSNGAPNDAPLAATKTITIYCSESNDPPAVSAGAWTVTEDAAPAKIFTGITLGDPDSFNNKIYLSLSVNSGTLDASAITNLTLSGGNPALWDKMTVVNNNGVDAKAGQTLQIYAERSKIEAALALLQYKPVGDYNGVVNVTIYANDLGNTGRPPQDAGLLQAVPANGIGVGGTGRFTSLDTTVTVTPVNDAPSASTAATHFWGDATAAKTSADFEDSGAWTGKTVKNLFESLFLDSRDQRDANGNAVSTTDSPANAFAGVVVVGNAATAQGDWQYFNPSLNGGLGDWVSIGSRALGNALYLDAATQIRFVPNGDFNGTPGALTVRLVDSSVADIPNGNVGTPAANYSVHDLSGAGATGGTTCFSSGAVALGTFVRAVNDAPTINGAASATLGAVNEDATNPAGGAISTLFNGRFLDAKDAQRNAATNPDGSTANTLAGVVVTGNAATTDQGVWQYRNAGNAWMALPDNLSEANGFFLPSGSALRFVPAENWNGTPGALTVHLVDNSAADATHGNDALPGNYTLVNLTGSGVNPLGTGGTTRYSADTVTLGTSVTAINDAPVVVGGNSATLDTIAENPANDAANPGKTVTDLFASHFNDDTDQVTGGSGANGFAGVLVVGNAATVGQGTWQYDDGTNGWRDIPSLTGSQGFALKETWGLRFKPADDFNGDPGKLSVRLIDSSATNGTVTPAASYGAAANIAAVGGTSRYSQDVIEVGIDITAVNDAPSVTTPSVVLNAPALTEDVSAATNAGNTVSFLFTPRFDDSKDAQKAASAGGTGSDANTLAGIIVETLPTGAQAAKGSWQYSNGSAWVDLEAGMFVKATDSIRFQPADGSDYNGTVTGLSVRLVENSGAFADPAGHASGEKPNLAYTADGPQSQDVLAVDIRVNAVNDAPAALNPATVVDYPAIDEDDDVPGATVTSLFNSRFSDARDAQRVAGTNADGSLADTLAGIIIQSVANDAAKGAWQYYDTTLSQWKNLETGMFVKAADAIRFQPATDWNGTPPDLTVYLVENSGAYAVSPASGTQADASSRGGATAVSSDALTLRAVVRPVNDAPFWNPDAHSPLNNGSGGHFLAFDTIKPNDNLPGSEYSAARSIEQSLYGRDSAYAYLDTRDDVTDGSSAQALQGVLVTGVVPPAGLLGTWQYNAGAGWTDIVPASLSKDTALYLDKNVQIRFKYDTSYQISPDTMPHSGLSLALVDASNASGAMSTGTRYDATDAKRGGANAVSADIVPLWVTVLPRNYYPEFTVEPAPVTVAERTPGQLAPGVTVRDINLDHSQSASHWNGASITIRRDGGANADDVFTAHASSLLSALAEGGSLTYNGVTCGTVTRNSGGELTLTFNSTATATEVNAILRLIDYTNASSHPPASVTLQWTIDDGNYEAGGVHPQGLNKSGDDSGTVLCAQTVSIVETNAAPVVRGGIPGPVIAVTEDTAEPAGRTVTDLFAGHFDDTADGVTDASTFAGVLVTGNTADPAHGVWQYNDGANGWQDIPSLAGGRGFALKADWSMRFTPVGNFNGEPGTLTARLIDTSAVAPGNPAADFGNAAAVGAVGGMTRYSAGDVTLGAAVAAVNDAPVVTGSSPVTVALDTIAEDPANDAANPGKTVTDLFLTHFDDSADAQRSPAANPNGSAANDFAGVLVTGNAASAAQGSWQYNDGVNGWRDIPALAAGQGFALKETWGLRFKPAENFNGEPGKLTVRLIDSSAAANGNPAADYGRAAAIAAVGGVTRYSQDAIDAGIRIAAVNDAPKVTTPAAVQAVPGVTEDIAGAANGGHTVLSLVGARFDDSQDAQRNAVTNANGSLADSLAGIIVQSVSNDAVKGAWQYDSGSGWVDLAAGMFVGKDTKIRFQPGPDWNGTPPDLTVYLVENTGAYAASPAAGTLVDTTRRGGATPVSSEALILRTTVSPVNDAPTASVGEVNFWGANPGATADFEDSHRTDGNWTGKRLSEIFGGVFRDAADQQDGNGNPIGSANSPANAFGGVAVVGNAATTDQGEWQYYTGSAWLSVGARSLDNALYLNAGTQIRFVPAEHFNGTPGALSVRMVDSSASDAAHGNPGKPALNASVHDLSGAGATGSATCFSAADVALNTFVRAVNDAPTVDSPAVPVTLPAVNEDAGNPAGKSVSDLFTAKFNDDTDDRTGTAGGSSRNSLAGVVITGNAATADQGVWQYSNGTEWIPLPDGIREASGFFLPSASALRFVPAENWNGTPGSLTVRLVDGSAADPAHGTNALPGDFTRVNLTGSGVNPQGKGGTTRYSSDTVILETSVAAVNDAPVANGGGVTLTGLTEGASSAGQTVANLFLPRFDDSRDNSAGSGADAFAGVLVTGNAATAEQGTWQYDDGSGWRDIPALNAGEGFALREGWNLRFNPAARFNGEPGKLTVRLIDSSAAASGNPGADYGNAAAIAAVGGVTRYSTGVIEAGIRVAAVNDAPLVINPGTAVVVPPVTEDVPPAANGGHLVSDLFESRLDDAADAQKAASAGNSGSSANTLAGIIIDALPSGAEAAKGAWQYYNGSQWLNLDAGMFVKAADSIRFQPAADCNGDVAGLKVRLVENSGAFAVPSGHASGDRPGLAYTADGPLSRDTLNVAITVHPVNDAPVAVNPASVVPYPAINEDDDVPGATVGSLFGGRFSDAKDARHDAASNANGSRADSFAGVVVQSVTSDPAKGAWQYFDGAAWKNLETGMFIRESALVRFQPVPDWNGTPPDLKVYLAENTGTYAGTPPASGTVVETSRRGGATPLSADALSLRAVVNPVNDAPFWNPDAYSPLSNGGTGGHFLYYGAIRPDSGPGSAILEKTVAQALSGNNGTYAYLDSRDVVPGGSNAQDLQGVLVTGVSSGPLGTWQYHDGAQWVSITAASKDNALYLAKDTKIRFVYDTGYDIPVGSMPHSGLSLALVDASNASGTMVTGRRHDASDANRGGTAAVSDGIIPLWVTVLPRNYYPEFAQAPDPATVTERTAGRLAPNVSVKDANLDNAQSSAHWDGASVTIRRDGGANADDVFTSHDTALLAALDQGANLVYNGVTYGVVTHNSGGTLTLSFDNNATADKVDAILRNIAYANESRNPPASVRLAWTVDDGNYERGGLYPQGLNRTGDASGTVSFKQTVSIVAVNDPPVAVDDDAGIIAFDAVLPATGNVLSNDWDYDGPSLRVSAFDAAAYGILVINPDGSYTYTVDRTNPLVNGMKPGSTLTDVVSYTISDGQYSSTATLRIVIGRPQPSCVTCPQDPAPIMPAGARHAPPPDNPHDLATPKPVVLEVQSAKEAIANSVVHGLDQLRQTLEHLERNAERQPITLTASMDDRVIHTGYSQTLSLPRDLFRHSDQSERLYYTVTLEDGRPLPPWLTWHEQTLTFSGKPDQSLDKPLVIKIVARDRHNNSATALFRLNVVDALTEPKTDSPDLLRENTPAAPPVDRSAAAPEAPAEDRGGTPRPDAAFFLPGAEGFNDQIANSGMGALFRQARESIAKLYG